jgi:hypothetical protein
MLRKLTACCQFAITAGAAFYVYGASRTGAATFGISMDRLLILLFAAVFLVSPVIVVASIIGSIVCTHLNHSIPAMRVARGLCVDCGYPRTAATGPCSECGNEQKRVSSRNTSLGMGLAVCALAAVTGGVAAESWISLDEASFKTEVAKKATILGTPLPYSRTRRWPNQSTDMRFEPGRGYWANK